MDVVCEAPPRSVVQQHVTSALWGLAQEHTFRVKIAEREDVITRMIELLAAASGETQKRAAATLVSIGQDEPARVRMVEAVKRVDASGILQMLKQVESKLEEEHEGWSVKGYLSLYQGIDGALVKEGPPSALYLGIYEIMKSYLLTTTTLPLLAIYLISGMRGCNPVPRGLQPRASEPATRTRAHG